MVKVYLVGGFVRDLQMNVILGTPLNKKSDVDYAVEAGSYEEMKEWLVREKHADIKVEAPQFFTIRALVNKEVSDYTLCRKESNYTDGRHPDVVTIGTIYDDLARRDFTMNAMAIDCDTGELLDPYNGIEDIRNLRIVCVGNASQRMTEDYLRMLRALRFSVTLGFSLDANILEILHHQISICKLIETVSQERIREELTKMFKYNTSFTLMMFDKFPSLRDNVFINTDLWLKPTFERR